jgi:hypothetical protein
MGYLHAYKSIGQIRVSDSDSRSTKWAATSRCVASILLTVAQGLLRGDPTSLAIAYGGLRRLQLISRR